MDMMTNMCQSCGMPMGSTDEHYGTEKDGSKSKDYCKYCYKEGAFSSDQTMEEMIKTCIPFIKEDQPEMTDQAISEMMNQLLPTLKRWQVG